VALKRATDTASRATGAIERFNERTLAPRLEELAGEVRGLRGEMQQLDKRLSESIGSLRNEMQTEIRSVNARIDASNVQVNTRIDALGAQVNTRIDALAQRLDDALNVRERLVAVEATLAARAG
jgi:hypothetical protein